MRVRRARLAEERLIDSSSGVNITPQPVSLFIFINKYFLIYVLKQLFITF